MSEDPLKLNQIADTIHSLELNRENFSTARLENFIRYRNEVLEKYQEYLSSNKENGLYLELLKKLTRLRGNMGLGKDCEDEEPITPLIKRMCTKAELAILEDYLNKPIPAENPETGEGFFSKLSHGIAKNIGYEKIEDELFRELSLLIAHLYELSLQDKIGAMSAISFYERAGGEAKYKSEIEKLRQFEEDVSKGAKKEGQAQILISETQAIIGKYKEQISLEAIMSDLDKIYKLVDSILE